MFILFLLSLSGFSSSDSNLSIDLAKQYKNDLAFVESIQGSAPGTALHQKIFGKVSGADYKAYYSYRISNVKMGDCGNKFAIACVSPMTSPRTIQLTDNYVKYSHPQIARLMVIFHETRHGELWKLGWGHDKCPVPFLGADKKPVRSIWSGAELAGEPACDSTPLGSYGSSVIMLKNIQKFCKNCSEKVRQDAGIYADDNFGRIVSDSARSQMKVDLYSKK